MRPITVDQRKTKFKEHNTEDSGAPCILSSRIGLIHNAIVSLCASEIYVNTVFVKKKKHSGRIRRWLLLSLIERERQGDPICCRHLVRQIRETVPKWMLVLCLPAIAATFLIHYLLTYSMEQSPWEANCSAASQEIPRIFGTRRFLTVITNARHLSLSWANSIQSPQPPPTSWRSILILSSHLRLGLSNGLFPSGFSTRTLCTNTLQLKILRPTKPALSV